MYDYYTVRTIQGNHLYNGSARPSAEDIGPTGFLAESTDHVLLVDYEVMIMLIKRGYIVRPYF